eukprot:3632988-Rhodomonas_salina.2
MAETIQHMHNQEDADQDGRDKGRVGSVGGGMEGVMKLGAKDGEGGKIALVTTLYGVSAEA